MQAEKRQPGRRRLMNNIKRDHIIIFIASHFMHIDRRWAIFFLLRLVYCGKMPAFSLFRIAWASGIFYLFPFWRRVLFHFSSCFFFPSCFYLSLALIDLCVGSAHRGYDSLYEKNQQEIRNEKKKRQTLELCIIAYLSLRLIIVVICVVLRSPGIYAKRCSSLAEA